MTAGTTVTPPVTHDAAGLVTAPVTVSRGGDRPPTERVQGGIETATAAFVESLGFPDGDPRALLGQIAVLLAQRVDETGAVPAAVRELRVLLSQLAEVPGQPAGKLDDLQVQRAQRRLDQILGTLVA